MSTAIQKPTTPSKASSVSSSAPPSVFPPLYPVTLRDAPAAQVVAHTRPLVLLFLLALRFPALVRDPVSELQAALPVVALVQAGYAVTSLPVAGSQTGKGGKKARPGEKKRNEALGSKPIVSAILSLLLTTTAIPAVYILFVLFGAPFLDYTTQTTLVAAHFALLTIFPILYTRGLDSDALVNIAGALAPLDETFGALVGGILGSWLGAVPIPLDWDREWQKWPVTILVGLYAGACLGAKVGGLFSGKRFVAKQQ